MKSSLIVLLSIALGGVAHAQIDRSAGALIDQANLRYMRFKSFHTTANTIMYGPKGSVRFHIDLSYQSHQRAAVVVTSLDNQGKTQKLLFRQLLGANSFYSTIADAPADVFPIKTSAERAKFLRQIEHSPAQLGLTVMSFAEPSELDPKTGKRRVTLDSLVKEGKLRSITRHSIGTSTQVRVDLGSPAPNIPSVILVYNLNNRTLFLESFRVERPTSGKKTRTEFVATYTPPTSNWKGSQRATDEQIYNWKVVAPHVEQQSEAQALPLMLRLKD